jgi:hypothetical protein
VGVKEGKPYEALHQILCRGAVQPGHLPLIAGVSAGLAALDRVPIEAEAAARARIDGYLNALLLNRPLRQRLRSALNSEPDLDRCAQLIEVADRSANGMHEPYGEAIGCPTT